MQTYAIVFTSLFLLLVQIGCANIKLVSSENNKYKFCTNPGNQIADTKDFDNMAAKQCRGNYRNIGGGLEFFTDPKTPKIGGILEVQTQKRMCRIYECTN